MVPAHNSARAWRPQPHLRVVLCSFDRRRNHSNQAPFFTFFEDSLPPAHCALAVSALGLQQSPSFPASLPDLNCAHKDAEEVNEAKDDTKSPLKATQSKRHTFCHPKRLHIKTGGLSVKVGKEPHEFSPTAPDCRFLVANGQSKYALMTTTVFDFSLDDAAEQQSESFLSRYANYERRRQEQLCRRRHLSPHERTMQRLHEHAVIEAYLSATGTTLLNRSVLQTQYGA